MYHDCEKKNANDIFSYAKHINKELKNIFNLVVHSEEVSAVTVKRISSGSRFMYSRNTLAPSCTEKSLNET